MPTLDDFHADLLRNVETAKKEYETRLGLLRAYESFRASQSPPGPREEVRSSPPPAPLAAKLEEVDEKQDDDTPEEVDNDTDSSEDTSETVEASGQVNRDGSPRKKPGPPKGFNSKNRQKSNIKAAAPAKVTLAARTPFKEPSRPGPKPGAKRSDVPPLVQAIKIVLGNKTMNADQVYEALEAKSWLPNSNDPKGYVRYTLSSKKEVFLRVDGRRGFYHLDGANKEAKKPTLEKPSPFTPKVMKAAPEATPEQDAEVSETVNEVDDLLRRSGIDLSGKNPFASVT